MIKAWHFSETAYPYLPPAETYQSIRVTLPSKYYDPEKGAALWDRYLDEWCIADDEGVEVMLNEHHQTATCVDPAAPLVLAALARLTKKSRLLILGNPIANRRQPVRVAEEMALADVMSRGRVEVGFVRGVPWEVAAANSNPSCFGFSASTLSTSFKLNGTAARISSGSSSAENVEPDAASAFPT